MNCQHCNEMRDRLEEIREKHGELSWRKTKPEISDDLMRNPATVMSVTELARCACSCHDLARFMRGVKVEQPA